MPHRSDFDYIIIGAGLSGLSLALEMLENELTASKKVLLIDKSFKNYPERTWCFWEKTDSNTFPGLIHTSWNKAEFFLADRNLLTDLSPYVYKMIRSQTFREFAIKKIRDSNITLLEKEITDVLPENGGFKVIASSGQYKSKLVFDSRFELDKLKRHKGHVFYQQFVGWFIETEKPVFDPDKARLMDFRANQREDVSFFYVLPESPTKALVEFTLFTQKVKPQSFFKDALKEYISKNFTSGYSIQQWEQGNIPMTDFSFVSDLPGLIPIGTAGGCSKTSTGYTFTFVQKQVKEIVSSISKGEVNGMVQQGRFNLYDRILLNILSSYPEKGAEIFYTMFEKNPAEKVLRFLNNESAIKEELGLFSTLPIGLFSKAAIKELAGIK